MSFQNVEGQDPINMIKYQQFKILSPGLFTTIQDNGRYGFQKFGVPISGVLDAFSAEIANFLVGNDSDAAVLEFTVTGPRLLIMDNGYIAVTGAQMVVRLNGLKMTPWSAFRVRPGDELEIGQAKSGCRGYLAVTGGIEVPLVMGSRSCYVSGKIGGHEGRPLLAGDILTRGVGCLLLEPRKIPDELLPEFPSDIVLRAIPGPQDDYFEEGLEIFFTSQYKVSPDANRMGYRLEGTVIKQKTEMPGSIVSESSFAGGIQIPPDGQPIILLVEQTVGGYTKIATVISSDLNLVAQASPGDCIRFQRVDLETAYAAKKKQIKLTADIKNIVEQIVRVKNARNKNNGNQDNTLNLYKELYPEC